MSTQPINCWEFMQCGREPDGDRVHELGECPVPSAVQFDRLNDGCNGGRYCWAITGSLCGGNIQGNMARKLKSCTQCEFFQLVEREQERAFILYDRHE